MNAAQFKYELKCERKLQENEQKRAPSGSRL